MPSVLLALIGSLAMTVSSAASDPPASDPGHVAMTQGGVTLSRWTIDAGGSTALSGAGFTLAATVGQPDAGLSSGGIYVLHAGFWPPQPPAGDGLFADGFE